MPFLGGGVFVSKSELWAVVEKKKKGRKKN